MVLTLRGKAPVLLEAALRLWLGVLLVTAPLPMAGVLPPAIGLFTLGLGFAVVLHVLWLLAGGRCGHGLPGTFPLLAYLLYGAVQYWAPFGSGGPSTAAPALTLRALPLTAAAATVAVLTAIHFRQRRSLVRLLAALLGMAFLQAAYGIVETFSGHESILGFEKTAYLGCVTGTFLNRNHLAAYLAMLLPVGLGLLTHGVILQRGETWREILLGERIWRKGFLALLLVVLGLGLVFSLSRAGVCAGLGAVLLFIVLLGRRTGGVAPRAGVALVGCAILFAGFWLGTDALERRFVGLGEEGADSIGARLDYWASGMQVIRDHVLWGVGPGAVRDAILPYRSNRDVAHFILHLHSDFLEVLAQGGVVGVACLALFLGAILRGLVRLVVRQGRPLSLGCVCGLVAVVLHGLVDFPFQIPALLWTAAALLGAAVAARDIESGADPQPPVPVRAGLILLALAVVPAVPWAWRTVQRDLELWPVTRWAMEERSFLPSYRRSAPPANLEGALEAAYTVDPEYPSLLFDLARSRELSFVDRARRDEGRLTAQHVREAQVLDGMYVTALAGRPLEPHLLMERAWFLVRWGYLDRRGSDSASRVALAREEVARAEDIGRQIPAVRRRSYEFHLWAYEWDRWRDAPEDVCREDLRKAREALAQVSLHGAAPVRDLLHDAWDVLPDPRFLRSLLSEDPERELEQLGGLIDLLAEVGRYDAARYYLRETAARGQEEAERLLAEARAARADGKLRESLRIVRDAWEHTAGYGKEVAGYRKLIVDLSLLRAELNRLTGRGDWGSVWGDLRRAATWTNARYPDEVSAVADGLLVVEPERDLEGRQWTAATQYLLGLAGRPEEVRRLSELWRGSLPPWPGEPTALPLSLSVDMLRGGSIRRATRIRQTSSGEVSFECNTPGQPVMVRWDVCTRPAAGFPLIARRGVSAAGLVCCRVDGVVVGRAYAPPGDHDGDVHPLRFSAWVGPGPHTFSLEFAGDLHQPKYGWTRDLIIGGAELALRKP